MQRRGPYAQQPYANTYAQMPAPGQPGLDAMAYGQGPYGAAPAPVAVAPMPVAQAPQYAPPQYAEPQYAPPMPAAPPPVVMAPAPMPAAPPPIVTSSTRPGLLTGIMARGQRRGMPAPVAYAPPVAPVVFQDPAYRLDAGDRLRVVVFGQEGLTNSYSVDAAGVITMPLIGSVGARGCTPAELAATITGKLKGGFIREPYVAVEIEAYRPFFILGEVTAPGQYPYVPNMTAESAVAIAGGYTPRAKRNAVTITRTGEYGQTRIVATPQLPLKPGDTITVGERWF